MDDHQSFYETDEGGAAFVVAALVVVALVVVGIIFLIGADHSDRQIINIDVPALTLDVTPVMR